MKQDNLKEFALSLQRYLDSVISIDGRFNIGDRDSLFEKESDDIGTKLDVLERIVQIVRFYADQQNNEIRLGDFLKINFLIENRHLFVKRGENKLSFNRKYLRPEELELPLLIFLLLDYNNDKKVLDLIESFINAIRPNLSIFDFEKTDTGVTRCFTNTRFAAKRLRDNGLLLFSKDEAFRTWRLSFLGIITAGLFYDTEWRSNKFDTIATKEAGDSDTPLYWKLWRVVMSLDDISIIKRSILLLCDKGNVDQELSKKIMITMNSVHQRLNKIFGNTESDKLTKKQKSDACLRFISEIHKLPDIEEFMHQLNLSFEKEEFIRIVKGIYTNDKVGNE